MKLFKKLHEALDIAETKLTQLQHLTISKQITLLKSEKTPLEVKLLVLPMVWEHLPDAPKVSFSHNFVVKTTSSLEVVVRTTSNLEELIILLRKNSVLAHEYFREPFKVNYAKDN